MPESASTAVERAHERAEGLERALRQIEGHFIGEDRTYAGPLQTLDSIKNEARAALDKYGTK